MSSDPRSFSKIDLELEDHYPNVPESPESLAPAANTDVGTTRLALRLVFGSIILGREEMNRRFTGKQAQLDQRLSTQTIYNPSESSGDRARYAAVGALVQLSDVVIQGAQVLLKTSDSAIRLASRVASPVTGSRPLGPLRRQFQRFEARGEQVLQGWVATGRKEEYLSRTLTEETSTEVIEEVLDYLAVSPEMDQLVQAQTQDMAGEVVGEIQERTSKIFVFRGLFRRKQP
jgi:hypothetical protein